MQTAIIHHIDPDSIAQALGLVPGDRVVAVNGRTDLEDLLDYRFEVTESAYLELWVRHTDGSEEIYEIEKDLGEDLGLGFESPLFTPIKTCNNACPFCFIDQQPDGLRPTLYVKDDDYRLSYFNNTYITLTNLTAHDKARIERLRPGPLYVSVHATDPQTRIRLLVNQKAGDILEKLTWLKNLQIPFHAQVVLCPGINDGPVLEQTLADLATLRPGALSVAVVPVGLTQYRGELPELKPVDADVSLAVIRQVEAFNQTYLGDPFVYLSDEFYLKANQPFPNYESYGGFPQLDDGVGTARMLLSDFFELAKTLPEAVSPKRHVAFLTGKLAAMILQPIVTRLNAVEGLFVETIAVENRFWGTAVDVAGLITGQDLLATLKNHPLPPHAVALIPSIMLKHGSQLFLDGETVESVSNASGVTLVVVQDTYSAEELLAKVLNANPTADRSLLNQART